MYDPLLHFRQSYCYLFLSSKTLKEFYIGLSPSSITCGSESISQHHFTPRLSENSLYSIKIENDRKFFSRQEATMHLMLSFEIRVNFYTHHQAHDETWIKSSSLLETIRENA